MSKATTNSLEQNWNQAVKIFLPARNSLYHYQMKVEVAKPNKAAVSILIKDSSPAHLFL
ncbi:MAG: hypothetical protein QGH52_05510 [Prochlorococcaceae cyanobacterium ETNP1_MAG_8]|nr:hypothetical protein [Prochlorococcaceae cyanobacterium ETNP1_MAG_8]